MKKQKAKIVVLKEKSKVEIPVLFNPSEYNLSMKANYSEKNMLGSNNPVIMFTSGAASTLKMTLYFEGYYNNEEKPVDVNTYIKKLVNLVRIDGSLHRPPVCIFEWGSFKFEGIIESVDTNYTMFTSEGMPIRARVDVGFKHAPELKKGAVSTPFFSPDRTKQKVLHQDEQLYMLAYEEYGDVQLWRDIAVANNIKNPRDIYIGQKLKIPAR